jgi:hypothetical protein
MSEAMERLPMHLGRAVAQWPEAMERLPMHLGRAVAQ